MSKGERGHATVLGSTKVEVRGGTIWCASARSALKADTLPRVIGRSECALQLNDQQVSAAHCEVLATPFGVRLRDLGSRNGTFVDGIRVGEVFLTRPATIKVGGTFLEFQAGETTSVTLPSNFGQLESMSPKMQAVFEQLASVARTTLNVHLTGESGTGKGYIAEQIHAQSKRARKPFVTIDIGRIPPTLIESTLFGHVKGAFSGATSDAASPFEKAEGGTVFIDEIGELPKEHQTRLLRVTDEKVVQRVGSTRQQKVDVRIVSATLRNLQEDVNRRRFRDDLFYRLGSRIELPPLSARLEDMPILVRQILRDRGRPGVFEHFSNRILEWMKRQSWPGNVRTLQLVLDTALQLHEDDSAVDVERAYRLMTGADQAAPAERLAATADRTPVATLIAQRAPSIEVERAARGMLLRSLNVECEGNISEIARRADLSRKVVRTELALLGARAPVKPWKPVRKRSA